MTLAADQFLQRLFVHVLPARMHSVRAYGLYASTKAEALDRCRLMLGQAPVKKPEKIGWQDYCSTKGERHPECCPICGKRLITGEAVAPQKQSPKPLPVPRPGAPPVPLPALPQAA